MKVLFVVPVVVTACAPVYWIHSSNVQVDAAPMTLPTVENPPLGAFVPFVKSSDVFAS